MQNAFDTVQRGILLQTLEKLAIRSTVSELVASYLGSRHQFMQLGEVQSEKLEIKSGVSRGSILGLFFISRLHIRRLL